MFVNIVDATTGDYKYDSLRIDLGYTYNLEGT